MRPQSLRKIQQTVSNLSFDELNDFVIWVCDYHRQEYEKQGFAEPYLEEDSEDSTSKTVTKLPEFRVTLTRIKTGERAIEAEDDADDFIGFRTKLGGAPNWIQGDCTPKCAECHELMTFVAQIDSLDCAEQRKREQSDEWMFGDCGMLYVFSCRDCGREHCLNQCY